MSREASRSRASGRVGRVRRILREVGRLFLPEACLGCGAWIPSGARERRVCGPCRTRLRALPAPRCDRCGVSLGPLGARSPWCEECRGWPEELAAARSAVVLEAPADRLVHALKYHGWEEVAAVMAQRMARVRLPEEPFASERAIVVPVPTTRARRRRRGYNQAAVLAREYAARLERPVVHALRRTGGGGSQVSLHPSQRRANVRGAFAPAPGVRPALRARPAILVDDVLTTGSTAGEAARVLRAVGAEAVAAVTFARALPYRSASDPPAS